MPSPSLLTLSQRLTSTTSLLLERSRVLSLNLSPSASSQNQIIRNLTLIKGDLTVLENDLSASGLNPSSSSSSGGKGKKSKEGEVERQVREMGENYDRLVEMLAEDSVGREKAKSLRREVSKRAISPGLPDHHLQESETEDQSFQITPSVSIKPPTPGLSDPGRHNMPFKDYPDDDPEVESGTGHLTPHELLSSQQVLMNDQDERLNLLSHSIGRQNHLSIQIGDELDQHHELLEETDAAMDRTTSRLNSAKRRLDRVAHDAKQYGSTITIVVLIFILLILIIVFKT